jgi:hypothetical protein
MINYFKNDNSFFNKLVLGAAATNATIDRLKELGFEQLNLNAAQLDLKYGKKLK